MIIILAVSDWLVAHFCMEQQPKDSTFLLFKHQVSGKAPKLVTSDNKMVLKCFVKPEYEFYNYFNKSIHISLP